MSDPYHRGQRIALELTTDPHTRLRPGDQGTVRGYHPDLQVLDVDWDSGSRLSMCLDAGDRVRILPDPDHPTYPGVRVQLSGSDGNVFMIIGRVADALRSTVDRQAAEEFTNAAFNAGSYDEVLRLVMRTVDVN